MAAPAVEQRSRADGGLACASDDDNGSQLGRTASEQECDLMIEALRRELDGIKNQLALLTYHLDETSSEDREVGGENDGAGSPDHMHRIQSSKLLSGTRSDADTPHTAAKKVMKAKEELEKAARAAVAEKERKKYYMGVMDRAEEEQRGFHDKYLQLMKLHVEQQRQRVQENSERLRKKMKNRERREKALRLQKKPVHFRSQLSDTDTAFLNKLYHSTFYQIVGIEHQMKRAGKLTKLPDLKEFWDLMLCPVQLPHDPQPIAALTQHESHSFNEEEQEQGDYVPWALTSLPPEQNVVGGRDVCARTRVEPLKLPQVRPIVDILNRGSPPTAAQRKEKTRVHSRKMQAMESSRQHTRHMYQQARANEMAMRRLLPDINSLGLDNAVESDQKQNLANLPCKNIGIPPVHGSMQASDGGTPEISCVTAEPLRLKIQRSSDLGRYVSPQQTVSSKFSRQPHCHDSVKSPINEKAVPPPLTMDALMKGGDVKESRGKNVLWSNYR